MKAMRKLRAVVYAGLICVLLGCANDVECKNDAFSTEKQMQEVSTEESTIPSYPKPISAYEAETQPVAESSVETETQPKQDTTPTEPATELIPTESSVDPTEQPPQTQPVEILPAETEPPAVETVPVETEPPTQTESTETSPPLEEIDTTILAGYGVSYACNTYGYESCPGLRDGFYPSYTCEFTTMEAGYAAVQGCVDDTTNTLLSRPGVQIVAEIDGVLCRARIDVTVTQTSPGVFEVAVYYE